MCVRFPLCVRFPFLGDLEGSTRQYVLLDICATAQKLRVNAAHGGRSGFYVPGLDGRIGDGQRASGQMKGWTKFEKGGGTEGRAEVRTRGAEWTNGMETGGRTTECTDGRSN